jgi:hypothetical protein
VGWYCSTDFGEISALFLIEVFVAAAYVVGHTIVRHVIESRQMGWPPVTETSSMSVPNAITTSAPAPAAAAALSQPPISPASGASAASGASPTSESPPVAAIAVSAAPVVSVTNILSAPTSASAPLPVAATFQMNVTPTPTEPSQPTIVTVNPTAGVAAANLPPVAVSSTTVIADSDNAAGKSSGSTMENSIPASPAKITESVSEEQKSVLSTEQAELAGLRAENATLLERIRRLELTEKHHVEQHKEEAAFLLDKRLLQFAFDGVFKAASQCLIDAHSKMAIYMWEKKQEMAAVEYGWKHELKEGFCRPTALVPALSEIVPDEFDIPKSQDPDETRIDAKTPDVVSKTPDVVSKTPDVVSKTPEVVSKSVGVISKNRKPMGWLLSGEALASSSAQAPRRSSSMQEMLQSVRVFAENKHNPFMATAVVVLPLMEKAVKLLESNPLASLDIKCHEIIFLTILTPCTELLSSSLQSAFKDGRAAYSTLLEKVERLKTEIETARAQNDLKTVVVTEEELIRVTKKALASNAALLELQAEPKHAERFLDGSSGKLAQVRSQMNEMFRVERDNWEDDAIRHKTDLAALEQLHQEAKHCLDQAETKFGLDRNIANKRIAEFGKEINDFSPSWNFELQETRYTEYNKAQREKLDASIAISKRVEAERLLEIQFANRRDKLNTYGVRNAIAQELVHLVQKIVDLGLDGVETELRLRLKTLNSDKVSLEQDLVRLFTLRHSLVANRERQLQTRLTNIDRKRQQLKHAMDEAASALEVEVHQKLANDLLDLEKEAASKREDLMKVSEDLKSMDADVAAENAFRNAQLDHPRISALAASQALVTRKKAAVSLENTLFDLTNSGIDPNILAIHLKQLATPGALERLISAATATANASQTTAAAAGAAAGALVVRSAVAPSPDHKSAAVFAASTLLPLAIPLALPAPVAIRPIRDSKLPSSSFKPHAEMDDTKRSNDGNASQSSDRNGSHTTDRDETEDLKDAKVLQNSPSSPFEWDDIGAGSPIPK